MIYNSFDPEIEKKAKEMAAGSLGMEMIKFPLRFAIAAFFGKRPSDTYSTDTNNGTVSLINFGKGPIAITCFHVVDGYRQRVEKDKDIIFQIGNLRINPLERIIDENKDLDLATLDLKGVTLNEVISGDEISSNFIQPSLWPPEKIDKGDYVTFGGFPGKWRWQPTVGQMVFDSYSCGACMVASASENNFICQFERDYWISAINLRPGEELHDLGGLSGSPVFVIRNRVVMYYEFVGIVYEFSSEFDLMFIRPARFIREDGTIPEY